MIPITSITKDSDVIGTLNSLPTNTKHILRLQWMSNPGGLDSAEFVIWIFDNLAQAEATLAYGKTFGQSALGLLLEFYGMLNPYRNSITANERVVLNIEGNMIAGASYVAKDMIIFMKEMEKYISEAYSGTPEMEGDTPDLEEDTPDLEEEINIQEFSNIELDD